MKTLGNISLCVMSLCFSMGPAHANGTWEVQGAVGTYFPAAGDLWNRANAFDLKAIYWSTEQVGLGITTGYQDWQVDGGTQNRLFSAGNFDLNERYKGDMQVIPLGVSAFLKPEIGEKFNLMIEGGIQYVIVDSGLKYERSGTVQQGGVPQPQVTQFSSDVDNGVVGRIAASLRHQMNPSVSFSLTLGYQFNIDEGEISTSVTSINQLQPAYKVKDDNDLSGFYVMIGLGILTN